LLTQVTDARFNPRTGFSRYYLNGGYAFVARMSPAVRSGKRDGRASRLFHLTGNRGSGRARRFRALSMLAALHAGILADLTE
jgi:hypothetical protein